MVRAAGETALALLPDLAESEPLGQHGLAGSRSEPPRPAALGGDRNAAAAGRRGDRSGCFEDSPRGSAGGCVVRPGRSPATSAPPGEAEPSGKKWYMLKRVPNFFQ